MEVARWELHKKQIDHILINKPFKNNIRYIKTTRCANCDSDHYLVKIKMKVGLKRNITIKLIIINRYDITKFKYAEHCKHFKNEICG